MENKKIIELIPNISEGGAETLVKDYCILLKDKEYNMEVVTLLPPSQSSSNYQILLKNGIKVTSLDKSRWFYKYWFLRNLWRYTLRPFYASFQLARIIYTQKPSCIHVHMRMLEYLARISFILSGIKLFYTCHNEPHLFFDNKKSWLEKIGAKKLIRSHNLQLIALHEKMRRELNSMFNVDNTLIVHNGVNFNRFKNVKLNRNTYRNTLGFSADDFIVGHIGRFNIQKNHSFLLKIFASLIDRQPNSKLLLVGDGALRNLIEQQIDDLGLRNRCVILEHRSDIPQLLSIMDVFLFPSLFEGLPVTLVEAQTVGVKSIVSNTITSECFFNNNLIPLSLDDPIEVWVDAIVDNSINRTYQNDIIKFDMNYVINYLGKLYCNEA